MIGKLATVGVLGPVLVVVVVIGAAGAPPATTTLAAGAGLGSACPVGEVPKLTAAGLTPAQEAVATAIISTGQAMGVPPQGWVVQLATARQESGLLNLANPAVPESLTLPHDGTGQNLDSVGIDQQRPSWGTVVQRMTPATAARLFFERLVTVPGWQAMPVTDAAQAVQHSGLPGAYAQWETLARSIVAAAGGPAAASCTTAPVVPALPGTATAVAAAAIRHAETALGTMYAFGGSCADPHSPDTSKHCDCSSLVMTAYAAAGISIPRTSEQQWLALPPVQGMTAANVALAAAPGDLLYYNPGEQLAGLPGHVVLALGNGRMLEAPHAGAVVHIGPIYTTGFMGARRPR